MKNLIISQIKGNALFYLSSLFLLTLVFSNPFSSNLNAYLKDQIESITLSLGLLVDLKTIAWAASSSHLPIIAGISASTLDTLTSAIKYLSWSDLLVTSQLLLLSLSKTLFLKIVLILSLLGTLISKFRTVSLKFLVIALLINPGLMAYVSCVKYIAQESQLDSGVELTQELQNTHMKYQNREQKVISNNDSHTSILKGMEEKTAKEIKEVSQKVEEGLSKDFSELKESSKRIKSKAINLLSSIAIQFILLPFLFFYSLFQLFKKVISQDPTDAYLGNTVKIQALAIIVIGVLASCTEEANEPKTDNHKTSQTIPKKESVIVKSALGIDVSHFQGDINWEEIKAHNISFAYTKATEGESFVDPKFQKNWNAMLNAGVTRGVYHFYNSGVDGKSQAEHFISTIGELKAGDLFPVIDLEQGSIQGEVEVDTFQKEIRIWLKTVEEKFGVKPIIYSNEPFANQYLNHPDFAEYHLWLAEYGVTEPKTPMTWKDKGWSIWQRTEKGSIEGEIGNVDHDTARVSLSGLVLK